MRKLIIFYIILLLLPYSAFATGQSPDLIIYEGEEYYLFKDVNDTRIPCFPLEFYYKDTNIQKPEFRQTPFPRGIEVPLSTNLWRGYIATWEIKDSQLFLKKIVAFIDEERADLEKLFPKEFRNGTVPAIWYSGKIKIMSPDKEFLFFEIENGKEKENPQISFSNEPSIALPEALALAQEYIDENDIDISKHYLDNIRLLFNSPWMEGKHWIITWKLKIPSEGGEIFIIIGMDKKIRIHKGI